MKIRRPKPMRLNCPKCGYHGYCGAELTHWGRLWKCPVCKNIIKKRKEYMCCVITHFNSNYCSGCGKKLNYESKKLGDS